MSIYITLSVKNSSNFWFLVLQSGKISVHLERVAHHIRERLDEIKRREIDRLRILARQKIKTMNGMDVFHFISIHGGMNLIFRLILLLQLLYAS